MTARARRVGIVGHTGRTGVRRAAARLAARLTRQGREVRLDEALAREMGRPGWPLASLASACQVLVSLGGDGTALRAARALAGRTAVLLPVNFGGLGFLTAAEEADLDTALQAALHGTWATVRRRPVRTVVTRRGTTVHRGLAMNDAVVKGAGGYAAVHLHLTALGSDLGHLVADGLVAASASGSTAYSLSAGGPVVSRDLDALVVTPVCPHTLGSRPLVLSARDTLEIRVLRPADRVLLLLDGQDAVGLSSSDRIRIGVARQTVRVFENPGRPLAAELRAKLGWQGAERRSPG